jgi:hypothetical protein
MERQPHDNRTAITAGIYLGIALVGSAIRGNFVSDMPLHFDQPAAATADVQLQPCSIVSEPRDHIFDYSLTPEADLNALGLEYAPSLKPDVEQLHKALEQADTIDQLQVVANQHLARLAITVDILSVDQETFTDNETRVNTTNSFIKNQDPSKHLIAVNRGDLSPLRASVADLIQSSYLLPQKFPQQVGVLDIVLTGGIFEALKSNANQPGDFGTINNNYYTISESGHSTVVLTTQSTGDNLLNGVWEAVVNRANQGCAPIVKPQSSTYTGYDNLKSVGLDQSYDLAMSFKQLLNFDPWTLRGNLPNKLDYLSYVNRAATGEDLDNVYYDLAKRVNYINMAGIAQNTDEQSVSAVLDRINVTTSAANTPLSKTFKNIVASRALDKFHTNMNTYKITFQKEVAAKLIAKQLGGITAKEYDATHTEPLDFAMPPEFTDMAIRSKDLNLDELPEIVLTTESGLPLAVWVDVKNQKIIATSSDLAHSGNNLKIAELLDKARHESQQIFTDTVTKALGGTTDLDDSTVHFLQIDESHKTYNSHGGNSSYFVMNTAGNKALNSLQLPELR